MAKKDYEWLRPFCYTDKQRHYLDALAKFPSVRAAADAVGIQERPMGAVIARLKKRAASAGVYPEKPLLKPLPEGQVLKGTSELIGPDGETKLLWVKSDREMESRQEAMRVFVEELADCVTPRQPIKPGPKKVKSDLMVGYVIGDHHFGMYAHGFETGGSDYDLKIAEELLAEAIDYLVHVSPPAETALICNLGDFLHGDDSSNRTKGHGHTLDVDTRYSKVIGVAARSLCRSIDRALEKHKKVHIVNCRGNHDDDSTHWLSLVLDAWFRNEPRVTVDMSPALFKFHQFGKCMICMTHGHTVKLADLPGVMAGLAPKMWGETAYRVGWTGHVHHAQANVGKENRGAKCFSFGVLPPNDAYNASLGYVSEREMHSITFHKMGAQLCQSTFNANLRLAEGT